MSEPYDHSRLELFGFPDPDDVGSSEYRAICECLTDGLKSQDKNDPDSSPSLLIEAMLTEFCGHADQMRIQLKNLNSGMTIREAKDDGKKYDVFVRNWYRKDAGGRIVPGPGRKSYIARGVNYAIARSICDRYNSTHKPGKLSRKAEFISI